MPYAKNTSRERSCNRLELLPVEMRLMIFTKVMQPWLARYERAKIRRLCDINVEDRKLCRKVLLGMLNIAATSSLLASDISHLVECLRRTVMEEYRQIVNDCAQATEFITGKIPDLDQMLPRPLCWAMVIEIREAVLENYDNILNHFTDNPRRLLWYRINKRIDAAVTQNSLCHDVLFMLEGLDKAEQALEEGKMRY